MGGASARKALIVVEMGALVYSDERRNCGSGNGDLEEMDGVGVGDGT